MKGGRGEEVSSVQLFSNWRNSRALENSLQETRVEGRERLKDPEPIVPFIDGVRRFGWVDPDSPRVALVFARLGVALRLDEGVNGSLQELPAEAAVQLGDGISWKDNEDVRVLVSSAGVVESFSTWREKARRDGKGDDENRSRGRRTWVSLRGVHLVRVLGLHRPIAAQEELPSQRGEEPADAVWDRLGVGLVGHALCTT